MTLEQLLIEHRVAAAGCYTAFQYNRMLVAEKEIRERVGRLEHGQGAQPGQWLIWSNDHKAWWRPDSAGYTSVMADAGRFDTAKAFKVCRANDYRAGSTLDHDCQPAEMIYPAPPEPTGTHAEKGGDAIANRKRSMDSEGPSATGASPVKIPCDCSDPEHCGFEHASESAGLASECNHKTEAEAEQCREKHILDAMGDEAGLADRGEWNMKKTPFERILDNDADKLQQTPRHLRRPERLAADPPAQGQPTKGGNDLGTIFETKEMRQAAEKHEVLRTGKGVYLPLERYNALIEAEGHRICKARAQGTPGGMDPVDCDWPFCGCDPKADKVIEAIEESGFKIVQTHQWYDTICGACQLMDAWKSSDPQIWSEWDQQIRDRLSEILAALSGDKVSKENR